MIYMLFVMYISYDMLIMYLIYVLAEPEDLEKLLERAGAPEWLWRIG